MENVQTFKTPTGQEMVILPKADYDRLVAHRDDETDDDVRAAHKVLRRVEAGTEPLTPLEVYKSVRQGVPRLRAWRLYRRLSSAALADKIGKSQAYLLQMENGTRKGAVKTLSLLAQALGTRIDSLVD